jgi:hypothetical protein
MKTIYSVFLILVITAVNIYSQASMQWSYIYDNNNVTDNLQKMVVDNQGTIFLAGFKSMFSGSYIPQPFIAKVSSSGSLQYTRSFTHPYGEHQYSRGIFFTSAVPDNQGGVITAGHIDSGTGFIKAIVVKYNSAGDTVWTRYTGINDTMGYAAWGDVKLDNSGNVYVTGHGFKLNPYRSFLVTAKYNQSGVLQWIKNYVPPVIYNGQSAKFCLEIDYAGNVVCASDYSRTSSGNADMLAMKYSSSGSLIWAANYNGVGDRDDLVRGMKTDASGNVYVVGRSENINSNMELACVKFSFSNGTVEWAYKLNGSLAGFDDAYSIDIKGGNEIYVGGTINNSATFADGVLIKLNAAGNEQWKKELKTERDENIVDIKCDVTGIYTLVKSYYGDYRVDTRKYNSSGDTLWSASYHVSGRNEIARCLAVGPSNNLYIAGDESWANNTGYVYLVRYTHFLTGLSNLSNEIPQNFSLSQNYPNPFNPVTNITFSIPKAGYVKLTVFDITGKEITKLVNGGLSAGTYNADFNASSLSSGAYFYRLETEGFTDIKKMILVK